MGPLFGIAMLTARAIWFCLPHRYPVPGTRVHVNSYTHDWKEFDGTVVGPEYRFADPFSQKEGFPEEGKYLSGDPRWEQMWVVMLDDGKGTLEQHDLPKNEMISGYETGIPLLHWLITPSMWGRLFRPPRKVAELPFPIEFYPEDTVLHKDDPPAVKRKVLSYSFGYDGRLSYEISETREEWQEAERRSIEEASKTNRARVVRMAPSVKYHDVEGWDLLLCSRGNYYHLAHGNPDDLRFEHVVYEVEFWRGIGIWVNDSKQSEDERFETLSLEEAKDALRTGTIDTVHTTRELAYSPIVLPERFAKFRDRSRAASLEYLEHFAGKYSFDIFPARSLEDNSI